MAKGASGAPIQKVVFDTDVLIWYFRGNPRARQFLGRVSYPNRSLSSLSLMELIQGCRSRDEMGQVKGFIRDNIPVVLHPDEPISRRAIDLLEEYAVSDGLRVVDALIAATALEAGCSLATANLKHYRPISRLHLMPFRP